jgi:hypothetical protein
MKNLRQFCIVVVLTFALTLSAFAGDMSCPGITDPPPPQQSSATGDISCPGATATGEISTPGMVALDPVTEAALSLLNSILSLY